MGKLDEHRQKTKETADKLIKIEETTPLETFLNQERLELFNYLGDTLFIDDESLSKLKYIRKRLGSKWTVWTILNDIDDSVNKLNAIYAALDAKNPKKGELGKELSDLQKYQKKIEWVVPLRHGEFDLAGAISDVAGKFEGVGWALINKKEVTSLPVGPIEVGKVATIKTWNLNIEFVTSGAPKYNFYDKELQPLEKSAFWSYVVVSLPALSWGEKKVAMKWLSITVPGNEVEFKDIELLDPTTGGNVKGEIDFSKNIELSIGGAFAVGTKNVAHQKLLKFKLKDYMAPTPLSAIQQNLRYNSFNMGGKPMNEYTEDFYGRRYKEVENKLIDERIGNAVPDEQKPTLRERIRNLTGAKMPDGMPFSPCILETNWSQLGPAFKKYFFDNVKPSDADAASHSNYDMFLLREIPGALNTFLDKELKRQMESVAVVAATPGIVVTRDLHTPMTKEILTFRQEQEERSQDERSQSQWLKDATNPKNRKTNAPRRPKLTRSGLWWMRGKKDVSYLRFFHNKSETIAPQKTRIITDEKNNKIEDVGYTWDIRVEAKAMYANFKLDNGREVKLHGGNQTKLLHILLNDPQIPYGKMRVHMAYNVIKAMIRMAHKNNITLEYADKKSKKLVQLTLDSKDDIIIQHKDETTGKVNILSTPFSEKEFALENDMHYLRKGIEWCMVHFNTVMNKTHKQYKQATEKSVLSYFKHTRSRFPTTRLGSPLKKLMNIRGKIRTLKFDFDGLSVWGYSVSFKKNKFTISGGTLAKPIASRDLGKLLNHRVKGVRLFDGMELQMVSAIYQELIKHLRENAKLANTNFGVKDTIKQRVYFINETGTLCYTPLTAGNKNPIKRAFSSLRMRKDYGEVKKGTPSNVASPQEANEFYQNPLLMGKLMKAMNLGLYKF